MADRWRDRAVPELTLYQVATLAGGPGRMPDAALSYYDLVWQARGA